MDNKETRTANLADDAVRSDDKGYCDDDGN